MAESFHYHLSSFRVVNATSGQGLGQGSFPPDALTPQGSPGGTTTAADLKLPQPVTRTQTVPKWSQYLEKKKGYLKESAVWSVV